MTSVSKNPYSGLDICLSKTCSQTRWFGVRRGVDKTKIGPDQTGPDQTGPDQTGPDHGPDHGSRSFKEKKIETS